MVEDLEGAALMKADRIRVRPNRAAQRLAKQEWCRQQRESDRGYWEQLAQLADTTTSSSSFELNMYATAILDCQGSLSFPLPTATDASNNGSSSSGKHSAHETTSSSTTAMHVNTTKMKSTVPCHAALVKRRCPWLYNLIQAAQREKDQHMSLPVLPAHPISQTEHDDATGQPHVQVDSWGDSLETEPDSDMLDDKPPALQAASEEEDTVQGLHLPGQEDIPHRADATKIENDDDDDEDEDCHNGMDVDGSVRTTSVSGDRDIDNDRLDYVNWDAVWVILPNHPPQAVKLLLEYCYTNRVVSLGKDAFVDACRTRPHCRKLLGPVPPYPVGGSHHVHSNNSSSNKRWPMGGEPMVDFEVAIATLRLAEEAGLPRLSLMCQVAAAQLVRTRNVLSALCLCEQLAQTYGNPLPRLRQAAVQIILLSNTSKAADRLLAGGAAAFPHPEGVPGLHEALRDQAIWVVPPLLTGTLQAVQTYQDKRGGEKRDWKNMALTTYDHVDREDRQERKKERWKRRAERLYNFGKDIELESDYMLRFEQWQASQESIGNDRLLADGTVSLHHPTSRHTRLSPKGGGANPNVHPPHRGSGWERRNYGDIM
jgi:hypothetical protein